MVNAINGGCIKMGGGKMTKLERVEELFKGTDLEDIELEGDTAEELIENIEQRIGEEEMIYYSNAMKYLAENDASLQDSLALADELGYELKNLSSETLATLLQQSIMREKLSELKQEIEDIFESEDNDD